MDVDKDDIHSGLEYVTLACQLSPSVDKIETVHLKVTLHNGEVIDDQNITVMQACAVIVGDAETNTSGVYEGIVSMNEAATESRYEGDCDASETTAKDKSVSIWLQDAREALTRQCTKNNDTDNFGKHDTKYVYCLQVQNKDNPETVILSWKIKHKFYMVCLGSICLSKVTTPSELIGQMSVKFIKPLICSLLTEKIRYKKVICESSKTKNQLLEDNKRLIDELKSMTEFRQRDDKQMMARFLEILNAKKVRIAELQYELSQLKKHQNVENLEPTIQTDEEELLTVTNRRKKRGIGRCHDRSKTNSNAKIKDNCLNDSEVALKKQKTENINVHQHFISEPVVMDVEISATATVNEEVKVPPVVDNSSLDPFEANTQIDPLSDNSNVSSSPESPPWLRPSSPIQLPEEQQPMQSSPLQQPLEQKSVLDTLWHGIL